MLQGINLFCPLPEQVFLTQAVLLLARQPVLYILVFLPLLFQHLYLAVLGLHCMPHVVHLCYMLSHCLRQNTTWLQSRGEGCIAHGSASDRDNSKNISICRLMHCLQHKAQLQGRCFQACAHPGTDYMAHPSLLSKLPAQALSLCIPLQSTDYAGLTLL